MIPNAQALRLACWRSKVTVLGNAGVCVWGHTACQQACCCLRPSHPAACSLRQDIGEAETHELEGLYKPLLGGLLEAVLSHADLSSQGIQLEGLDLQQLVRQAGWLALVHSTQAVHRGGAAAHAVHTRGGTAA